MQNRGRQALQRNTKSIRTHTKHLARMRGTKSAVLVRARVKRNRTARRGVGGREGAAINVERGRPCDRRPANQLFSFVVPPSSFPVRVHAEAAGTDWPQDSRAIIPGP